MSPDLFLKLAVLSLSKEQMEGVVDVLKCMEAEHEAKIEKSREKARARLQKWREKPENVSKRFTASQNVLKPLVQADDAPDLENKQTNKPENKKTSRASHEAAFRAELAADLDAERLDAIVQHRQAKNSPVTAYSARLFRKDATACRLSLPEAVDMCISRGWITVKPEYLTGRQQQAPPHVRSMDDALDDFVNGKTHDEHPGPTIDASFSRADFGGAQGVVSFDAFAARQRS